MRLSRRFASSVGLLGVLFAPLLVPTSVSACSCVWRSEEEFVAHADAVFVGTVTGISDERGRRPVEFDVSETRKGTVGEHAQVLTAGSSAACGFEFETGKTYVVYATGDTELSTGLCNGTALLEEGVPVVPADEPEVPADDFAGEVPAAEPEREDAGDSTASLLAVAIVAYVAGLATARLLDPAKTA